MKPAIIHTIGEFACPDAEILHVDWNGKAMMIATSVANWIVRGTGLLYLVPDVLHRLPLNIRIGDCIAPSAPIVRTAVADIRNGPDLPVCTQCLPDLLLDLPKGALVFQSANRLVVTRWDNVLAMGWRGSSFWIALVDTAYVIHPRTPVPPTDRIQFLQLIFSTRTPKCYAVGLSDAVATRYDLRDRYLAVRIDPLPLEVLAADYNSIRAAIPLSGGWAKTVAAIQQQGRSIGD